MSSLAWTRLGDASLSKLGDLSGETDYLVLSASARSLLPLRNLSNAARTVQKSH
jgi:hypothetical protein